MNIVILGLSITSSWGNGHATTYRGLVGALAGRGHQVVFLERDMPWYAGNRDLPHPPWCRTHLYRSVDELKRRFAVEVHQADLVIVGSYVPEGRAVGDWVTSAASGLTAFYDIDTPVTLAKLESDDLEYLSPALVPRYDLYLSFTGGPILRKIEERWGSPMARPLHCSFDPDQYFPATRDVAWSLGYLGTYSADRQPVLDRLLVEPARRWRNGRFIVAGPQYPDTIEWPSNVERITHLPPREHRHFYNGQRFTLNVTRAEMVRWGWSPSVRLFEAAACGVPIISDWWEGLSSFFHPDREIVVAGTAADVLSALHDIREEERIEIGARARSRVLHEHTAAHRAAELVRYVEEARGQARTSAEQAAG